MIKVCHMTSAHNPEDDRIFHKECISLARNGYDVTLIERGESYEKENVHIVGIGMPSGGRLGRGIVFAHKVYLMALKVDADIYHLHDPELLPYGLKLKKKGKYVIFDSHERYTEQLKNKPYLPRAISVLVASIYAWYEKKVLKTIDAVIFPCTMYGKDPFAGMCKRSQIISNAAMLDEFFDLYEENTIKKENQICYVGGLTQPRGITSDIKAAKKAGAVLALAGEFSPKEYGEEVAQMEEYSCVDYRGSLTREGVRELLAESQIGLCTLLNQGQYWKVDTFSIKVFEYMSMGLPVILNASEHNKKMVEQYQIGICVDPDNIDELSDAIQYLLEHPEEAQRMGANGQRAILEEFNWGVEEKKLQALYEDILNEH